MNDWNVLLQLKGVGRGLDRSCVRYAISGIALPVQITIVACDPVVANNAQTVHDEIARRLSRLGGHAVNCTGPSELNCMSWEEASCRHILLLIIGSAQLDPQYEQLTCDWLKQGGTNAVVLPALLGKLSHAQVFGSNKHPTLSHCNLISWGGSSSRLAEIVLLSALIDERPGVFVSYLRNEASLGAEQIHDALIHSGFRVYLDRFSGMPGRLFPHELAEGMTSMGLVVLLETQSLGLSRWTMWEAAFAHRYRIGPIAVEFGGAKGLRVATARQVLADDPSKTLPDATVERIVQFIKDEYVKVALARRIYYETLILLAAKSKGGDVRAIGAGVLEILDGGNNTKGFALPNGAPGELKHVRHLVETTTTGKPMLAGEHQHLSPSKRSDLEWLTAREGVILAGSASIYQVVRSVM